MLSVCATSAGRICSGRCPADHPSGGVVASLAPQSAHVSPLLYSVRQFGQNGIVIPPHLDLQGRTFASCPACQYSLSFTAVSIIAR
jgi:hypothetical protein